METLVEIIKVIIWPLTILISVLILRKGILELFPKLKKLKYKDLEIEFEKEAIEIQSKVERDIPQIEPPKIKPSEDFSVSEPTIMYSTRILSPPAFISSEWERIEKAILSLSKRRNIQIGKQESVRMVIRKLRENDVFDEAVENSLMEISAYRNKVSHTRSDIITEDISNIYYESSKRLINYLNSL